MAQFCWAFYGSLSLQTVPHTCQPFTAFQVSFQLEFSIGKTIYSVSLKLGTESFKLTAPSTVSAICIKMISFEKWL